MRLFFYGTLMDEEMIGAVLGRAPAHVAQRPAALSGYSLRRAEGYTFPVLFPDDKASVTGVCAEGLTEPDIERIRYFEDIEYDLRPFEVDLGNALTTAHAFCPTGNMAASPDAWDLSEWQRNDKPLLLAITREVFTNNYGITPLEEIDAVWHQIRARLEREMKPAMRRTRRRIA